MVSPYRIEGFKIQLGGKILLEECQLEIPRGSLIPLTGESGSGKTTLAKILSGLESPLSGKFNYTFNEVAYMPQNGEDLFFLESVRAEWEASLSQKPIGEKEKIITSLSSTLGVQEEWLNKNPSELSGGEKKIALLGLFFAIEKPFLILDEPLAGLDWNFQNQVLKAMKNFCDLGKGTLLFITHELNFLKKESLSGFHLKKGKLIPFTSGAEGDLEPIFSEFLDFRFLNSLGEENQFPPMQKGKFSPFSTELAHQWSGQIQKRGK